MFSLPLAFLALAASKAIAGVIPLTDDCIKGVTFEGTPKGNIKMFLSPSLSLQLSSGVLKTINGVSTYVAKAQHPSNSKRALLLLTGKKLRLPYITPFKIYSKDIFGLPLVNSKVRSRIPIDYRYDLPWNTL